MMVPPDRTPRISISAIRAATVAFYGAEEAGPRGLRGHCGPRQGSRRRQVAMALSRRLTDCSYPQIAARFGVDHTTVIHAVKAVAAREAADPALAAEIAEIAGMARRIAGGERAARIAAFKPSASAPPREIALRDAWRGQIAEAQEAERATRGRRHTD